MKSLVQWNARKAARRVFLDNVNCFDNYHVCAELAMRVQIQTENGVFFAKSVYSSWTTLRSDLDNVPFYLANAEINCNESAKERFLVAKKL